MPRAHLALGSNVGDRAAHLRHALDAIASLGAVEAASSVYETAPVGFARQGPFWNLVLRLSTTFQPEQLLGRLLAFEVEAGRTRSFRNAPRTLDIDILLYDRLRIDLPGLRVPHARMLERAFVLEPLAEIDGLMTHPETRRTIAEHRAQVGAAGVVRLGSTQEVLGWPGPE